MSEYGSSIHVSWYQEYDILLWKFDAFWDWLSFDRAVIEARELLASIDNPVVELFDFSEGNQIPPDILSHGSDVFSMDVPDNLAIVVAYGLGSYAKTAYRVLSYITPLIRMESWHIKIVDDFDEALCIAQQILHPDESSTIA